MLLNIGTSFEQMQTSLQIQNLTDQFEKSRIFFYLLIDLHGNCRYINPFLKEKLNVDTIHFESISITEFLSTNEAEKLRKACEEVLQHKNQIIETEIQIVAKENVSFQTKWEISVCNNAEGNAEFLQAIGFATPEAKPIDKVRQLQDGELLYKNLIAESLDGIVLSDINGVIDFASPSIVKILGYEISDVLGRTLFDFAHPDDVEVAAQTFEEEVKGTHKSKFINIRLIKKNGEPVWCIVRGHNMLSNPHIGKMVIYFSDETLRKQAEAALIESEKRFKTQATVLNNVTDVIVTTDLNRNVTSWNNVIEKLTGISSVEAIGKRYKDVIDTDYAPYTLDQVANIVINEGIWRGEISFNLQNGEKKYFLHSVSMLYSDTGESIGMLGVGKDITERKKAATTLQESELFYRRLSYYSIDGVVIADQSGKITYCGASVERISGYNPTEMLGRNFFEFVHPDDIPLATDAFLKELRNESVLNYIFLRLKHSNGEWTWCTVRGHNLLETSGVKTFVIYFTNDTKRKHAEDQLRKSEENFRNLIVNLKQGVILSDNNGITTICNQAAQEMLGLNEKDILGKKSFEFHHDIIMEDGQSFSGSIHPVSEMLNSKISIRDIVMGIRRKDTGGRAWLLVNADPILSADGILESVVCSLTDITDQKRLAEELFEQEINKQKLLVKATIDGQEKEREEIGKELHDNINQYLTTARLYLEVAKEKADGEVKEMINLSHKTLSDIVKEIRKLSQSLVPLTLGDIGLVESIQGLCDSIIQAHTIEIELHSRHFEESVLTDNLKLMLFRIFQEQLNNILRHSEASHMHITFESDAEYVLLMINDDGKGFDTTTHKKGRGLSNISSRANLMNGKMDIKSSPGNGCTLSILIPILDVEKGTI